MIADPKFCKGKEIQSWLSLNKTSEYLVVDDNAYDSFLSEIPIRNKIAPPHNFGMTIWECESIKNYFEK